MALWETTFGSIINLRTNTEIHWDGVSVEQVRKDISELAGFRYGTDWKYAGDLDIQDCDIVCNHELFVGKQAIADLAKHLNFETRRIMLKAVDAYNNLPTHMQAHIDSFLHDNQQRVLTSEKEVIDAYLTWNGIINYTDDIVLLVRSAYGDLK